MISDITSLREQFPILREKIYSRPLIYFDNAATAQKPLAVIELTNSMLAKYNGNVHRAPHKLANESTLRYEEARDKIKTFINAAEREEIIFTSGTTASINLVANCFLRKFLNRGDSIILSQVEHHSNIVPWQLVANEMGLNIKVIPADSDGNLCLGELDKLIDDSVKLISIAHISNVTGLINPLEEVISKAKARGIVTLIDGAQGIVHEKVDVQKLGCDFYAFSAHKLYGPTGVGILYGKREILEEMPPWMGGGDMIEKVSFEKTTFAPLPLKFEAGTPNYVGAAATGAAIDFINDLDPFFVNRHESEIVTYLSKGLEEIDGIKVYGKGEKKIPLFSFSAEGVHHNDLAQILDKAGIALRSGKLCAEPLIESFGVTGVLRASLLPYNSVEEISQFISALKRAINMLRN
jgi:cysteine desulfurase/selenocysteine lyase